MVVERKEGLAENGIEEASDSMRKDNIEIPRA